MPPKKGSNPVQKAQILSKRDIENTKNPTNDTNDIDTKKPKNKFAFKKATECDVSENSMREDESKHFDEEFPDHKSFADWVRKNENLLNSLEQK